MLARQFFPSVTTSGLLWALLFAWAGLGASFGTSLIFSLYWKRTTRGGVIAGMITGTVVTILWRVFLKAPTGIYELIPAFVCSSLAIALLGIARRPPPTPPASGS